MVETVDGACEGVNLPASNLGRASPAWRTGPCLIGRSVTVDEWWKLAGSTLMDGNLPFSYVLDILLVAEVLLKSVIKLVFLQIGFTTSTGKAGRVATYRPNIFFAIF